MNIPFQYRSISKGFIRQLRETALDGESMVLLGPRYGGKRHVMSQVSRYLSEAQAGPIVWVKCLSDPPVSKEQKAEELLQRAVVDAEPALELDPTTGDLLDAIDQLGAYAGKRVVLLAANVDGMAHHLARRFLEGVRRRVEERRLVVVLSGEDDFRDLVYGPNSEFNCANQFVLQGFAEDEFDSYVDHYLPLLREDFKLSVEKRKELWARTGGNVFLMRMVLRSWIEIHVRSADLTGSTPAALDIPITLKKSGIPGTFGAPFFQHATDLISRDPDCWEDLGRLIKGNAIRVAWEDNPPGRLELAGIATRDGNHLKFASELMQNFVTQHYDDRRFGDLYASHGLWEKAFERYALLSLEETMRPSGTDDKPALEAAINSLCASLHAEAAKTIDAVQTLFVKGCRYLLGFRDITFWQNGPGWKPVPLKNFTPTRENLDQIAGLLPHDHPLKPGSLTLGEPLAKCSVAAILPALGRDQQGAVVVGDFEKRTVISRERDRLGRKLFEHFVAAYSHAVSVTKTERRLRVRDKHVRIINSIFNVLGSEVINAHQVITLAAKELRQLGYSRVLFCLVDPKQQRIQGVWDDSDNKSVDVAEMTDWPLDPPTADLQPYVIFTKKAKIVPNAAKEPLANVSVVEQANMKAEAIVPILNPEDEAIGTIHVERTDGTVPRQHEVDDLLLFGRQLAVAIEQSDRVDLLQSALDKIPEPVLIIDSLEKTRYSNKAASDLIGTPLGWQSRSGATHLPEAGTDQIREYLRKTLKDHGRRVHHLKGVGNDPNYRGAVLFDKMQDWRNQTVGALLHIEDLNYFIRVFDAFRFIAEANDRWSAMESMLQSMEKIGHKWGRLYVVDEQDPDRLKSKLCFGAMQPQDREDFNRGDVVLQLHSDPNQNSWRCIDEKKPLVCCWDETSSERDILTEHGLRALNVNPSGSPKQAQKKPGDFWIDLPLFAEEKALGKMTLQCDSDFRPENFEMLKVFFEGLMDAVLRREREFKQQERLMQQAADEMVGLTAHNINSHLAALKSLLSRYTELEPLVGTIKDLNVRFKSNMEIVSFTINRMKERIGPLNLKPREFDLVEGIRQVLSTSLSEEERELSTKHPAIEVCWDYYLIRSALTELVHNSRAFIPETRSMSVRVTLELESRGAAVWVKIVYSDNGIGVPSEFKNRIFDQFFSHRPGKERSTGIGLRFVRRVVQEHGGTVREIGQPGRGAEFEMLIPQMVSQPL